MSWSQIACCILSNVNFVAFSWAIYRYFRFSESTRGPEMLILKYFGLATTIVMNWFMIANSVALWHQAAALAFEFVAAVLFWWSIASSREMGLAIAFSRKLSPRILTSGPYRWIRHPFYLSYMLHWVAGVFATGENWLCGAVVILSYFYLAAALQEERDILASPLATDYKNYRLKAGMFLPRLQSKASINEDPKKNDSVKSA